MYMCVYVSPPVGWSGWGFRFALNKVFTSPNQPSKPPNTRHLQDPGLGPPRRRILKGQPRNLVERESNGAVSLLPLAGMEGFAVVSDI